MSDSITTRLVSSRGGQIVAYSWRNQELGSAQFAEDGRLAWLRGPGGTGRPVRIEEGSAAKTQKAVTAEMERRAHRLGYLGQVEERPARTRRPKLSEMVTLTEFEPAPEPEPAPE